MFLSECAISQARPTDWTDFIGITELAIPSDKDQLTSYINAPVPKPKEGSYALTSQEMLQWWKQHESALPKLSALAKRYLGIQASSSASERVFSVAGYVMRERRSKLSPQLAADLVFLNGNRRFEKQ